MARLAKAYLGAFHGMTGDGLLRDTEVILATDY